MNDPKILSEILKTKKKFPCLIDNKEAEILKDFFHLDQKKINQQSQVKELHIFYHFVIAKKKYTLLEEYLFRDNETILELNRAIGKNFYLDLTEL